MSAVRQVSTAKAVASTGIPVLPPAVKDNDATQQIMHTLRHFHLGNPSVKDAVKPVSSDYLPALLEPYRDVTRLRYDYPLFLFPAAASPIDPKPEDLARPLSAFLQETVNGFAPSEEAARILKDNLPWLEREARVRLSETEGPVAARPLLQEAATALSAHLKLDRENAARLQEDLEKLHEATPEQGQLLAYGRYPAIHLLIHVIRSSVIPRHARFRREIEKHIKELKLLLDVDLHKSPESKQPEKLRGSVGGAGDFFDTGALSKVMDHSHGSVVMPAERRARIEGALQALEAYRHNNTLVRFIHNGALDDAWLKETEGFEAVTAEDPCEAATRLFDEEAGRLAKVFGAARIAELEIEGIYDAAIHDPFFANFDWETFNRDELLLVPAVIALESADHAAAEGMPSFSRLLNSGRPVQIFVRVQAHNNPGARADEDPFQNFRTELGYLGISHRQAVVSQASAARHQHLLARYSDVLCATRTSLHLINIGLRPTGQDLGLNAWLVAGAALEGRVHPFFYINPSAGDAFADRMDFSGNPQPEQDWPLHPFQYIDDTGSTVESELAFTFADYALLIPRLHHHFAVVPNECDTDNLVPIAEFLQLPEEEVHKHVPFVWAVSGGSVLHRVVISRSLVQACRDRLNFWHTLQEMGGVRNKYIDQAVARTREEVEAKAAEEMAALQAQFEEELARVRAEAAGEVMGRLTDVLMGMDFTSGAPRPALKAANPAPVATPAEAEPEQAIAAEAPVEEEEEALVEEPWIDTPLCTSCNDCLKVNPIMFIYNETNQAVIGDLSAGTFAQMVEAAELCPSKCIHPGAPWNPNEPNLDELKERAAKFN
jgi:ferredoxin